MKKKSANLILTLIGIIFLLVGLITITVGVLVNNSDNKFKKTANKTIARITYIDTERYHSGGEQKTSHTVYVEYRIGQQLYQNKLNYYSSSMQEGQEIEIYYNPENPNKILYDTKLPLLICGILGGVFTIIGMILIIIFIRFRSKAKKLKESGKHCVGTVTDVKEQTSVTINNRHPLIVDCKVEDPYTGEILLFSSKGYLAEQLYSTVGMSIDVYYDPANPKNHFVDVDSLLERLNVTQLGNPSGNIRDYR